ncbi:MAG: type II toxin-antitoxin system prevent-host-death family antitoxin [Pseudomonadota bacterium]
MQVNVHTAKTTLSDLILRAEAGEEIIIARRGKPAVRLVPVSESHVRTFGRFGELDIKGDTLAPLDDEELVVWE